jgi:hypothetical protein
MVVTLGTTYKLFFKELQETNVDKKKKILINPGFRDYSFITLIDFRKSLLLTSTI